MTETALVTGGAGFIGSHLSEALVKEGYKVRTFDVIPPNDARNCLNFATERALREVEQIVEDVRNGHAVKQAMKGVSAVFHLAAEISIPYSYKFPAEAVCTNVVGTMNVLMAANDIGVQKIVHTSSSEVYGSAEYAPIDEAHPLKAQSPYAASKIGADKLAESFVKSYGLPVVTIRPFNTFGPRQSSRAVIPSIIRQLISGESLAIGNTYPIRDFTFVKDTVRSFIMAAREDKAVGSVINIGAGESISIENLALMIGGLMGRTVEFSSDKGRIRPKTSEVDRLRACTEDADDILGWRPRVKLEKGLRETIAWFRAHPGFDGNDRG